MTGAGLLALIPMKAFRLLPLSEPLFSRIGWAADP